MAQEWLRLQGWTMRLVSFLLLLLALQDGVTGLRIPLQGIQCKPWRNHTRPTVAIPTSTLSRPGSTPPHPYERRTLTNMVSLTGISSTAYMAVMGFGTPAQNLSVVIDTGSANLAVAGSSAAGSTAYFTSGASSTFQARSGAVSVTYLQGSWTGNRVADIVTMFGAGVTSPLVEFSSIFTSASFFQANSSYPFNGILGLAYQSLAFPASNPITPYFDTLVAGGLDNTFSLQLCNGKMVTNNQNLLVLVATPSFMHLGGGAAAVTDLTTGPFYYAPMTEERYYSVSVARMSMGTYVAPFSCSSYSSPHAIVDSGSTNMLVPPAVFSWFTEIFRTYVSITPVSQQSAFFGGTACLTIANSDLSLIPNVTVTLLGENNMEFDLVVTAAHYLRAVSVSSVLPAGTQCRAFAIQPTSCGLVLGVTVMGAYTVVFDRAQRRVGFATSTCSNSSGVGTVPPIVTRATTVTSCAIDQGACAAKSSTNVALIVGVSIGVAAAVVIAVLIVMKVVAAKSAAAAAAAASTAGTTTVVPTQLVKTAV